MITWRRSLHAALTRLGADVQRLDGGAWLVQRPPARRTAHQVGPPVLGSHVVLDREAARERMNMFQHEMGSYLGGEHLAWLLRRLEVNVVLDVGANVGQFGRRLRRLGYRGRIVSFEPVPDTVRRLRRAAAGDPEWHVHACALGDADRSEEINVVRGSTMSSLLPSSSFGRQWRSKLGESHTEAITVRRLDGLFDEAVAGVEAPRVFLKMDTQGYDVPTFRGAGEALATVVGLQSEVPFLPIYDGMPGFPDMLAMYEAAGFATSGIFPITHQDSTLRAIEFDLMMVRPEAVRPRRAGAH